MAPDPNAPDFRAEGVHALPISPSDNGYVVCRRFPKSKEVLRVAQAALRSGRVVAYAGEREGRATLAELSELLGAESRFGVIYVYQRGSSYRAVGRRGPVGTTSLASAIRYALA